MRLPLPLLHFLQVLPHQPVSQLMMQQPAVRQLAAQQLMPAQQPHMSHQHAAQLHHVPQMLPGQQVQQPLQVEDQQLPDPWAAAMEPLSVRPVAAWQQLAQQQLPETPIVRQQVAQAHTSQPHASPPYAAPTLAAQRHSAMPHTMQQQVVQPPAAPRVMQPPAAQQQVGQQQQLVQQPEVCTHFSKVGSGMAMHFFHELCRSLVRQRHVLIFAHACAADSSTFWCRCWHTVPHCQLSEP